MSGAGGGGPQANRGAELPERVRRTPTLCFCSLQFPWPNACLHDCWWPNPPRRSTAEDGTPADQPTQGNATTTNTSSTSAQPTRPGRARPAPLELPASAPCLRAGGTVGSARDPSTSRVAQSCFACVSPPGVRPASAGQQVRHTHWARRAADLMTGGAACVFSNLLTSLGLVHRSTMTPCLAWLRTSSLSHYNLPPCCCRT